MTGLVCWRCGASLKDIPTPFARLAQCKACGADLHVCRLCRFYNPRHFEKCEHELAEPAREVDIANFCHYFRPTANAYHAQEKSRADDALAQLKALFGENDTDNSGADSADPAQAKNKLDNLFKKD
jgi:hypothetical protein